MSALPDDLLRAYVMETLEPDERARVNAALATDPDARARLADFAAEELEMFGLAGELAALDALDAETAEAPAPAPAPEPSIDDLVPANAPWKWRSAGLMTLAAVMLLAIWAWPGTQPDLPPYQARASVIDNTVRGDADAWTPGTELQVILQPDVDSTEPVQVRAMLNNQMISGSFEQGTSGAVRFVPAHPGVAMGPSTLTVWVGPASDRAPGDSLPRGWQALTVDVLVEGP